LPLKIAVVLTLALSGPGRFLMAAFALPLLPLVKAVGGHQTSALLIRLLEGRARGQRFNPGIDQRIAGGFIFCPRRD